MRAILILAAASAVLAAVPTGAHAQAAMARIQFEEAEAAFANNDINTTLRKLGEAERTLGAPNPPILRLRITAREQYVRGNASYDYAQLEALRADCATYSRRFANDNQWIDYTREIYPLCQKLTAYPATRAAREAQLQAERDRVAQAEAAQRAAQEQARQAEAQRLEAQRQALRARVPELEGMASAARTKGWIYLAGGGALVYTAAKAWPRALADDAEDSDILIAVTTGPIGLVALVSAWGLFEEAGIYSQSARDIRRQNPGLFSVTPTWTPATGALGVATTLRF